MKPVMFVGAVGAGKTSLIHALEHSDRQAEKTQCILFHEGAIDTPGEYAQIPRFYSALLVTAAEAAAVVIVQDATDARPTLPPGFAGLFPRQIIGVVTKIDIPGIHREQARLRLYESGVQEPIFFVSAVTGEGLSELIDYIAERRCQDG